MVQHYDVSWSILFFINTVFQPKVFKFFSNSTEATTIATTTTTSATTTLLSIQNTMILTILLLLLLISRSLIVTIANEPINTDDDGSCYVWLHFANRVPSSLILFLCSTLFSLLSPVYVFLPFYPFIILLISLRHLLPSYCCGAIHNEDPIPVPPFLEPRLIDSLYYYDLRWMSLFPINVVLRPKLIDIFFDYDITFVSNTQPAALLTSTLILLFVVLFYLRVSPKVSLADRDNVPWILVHVRYRQAWAGYLLICFLIFALVVPNIVFFYIYPWIILLSLWPSSFLSIIRSLLLRIYQAFFTLLSTLLPPQEHVRFEDQHRASLV